MNSPESAASNHNEPIGEVVVNGINVSVTDLGDRNIGTFGPPAHFTPDQCEVIAEATGNPEFAKIATNKWGCVDGRLSEEQAQAGIEDSEYADPQLAGGLAVTEAGASFMGDPATHRKHSETLATKTREAIEDGQEVVVHGDEATGKAGCRANATVRSALAFIVDNNDIIVPTVWQLSKAMGLDQWTREEDVMQSVKDAHEAGQNDGLWDVDSAEDAIDIMVANGATYQKLVGAHHEHAVRGDLTNGAFDKTSFVKTFSTEGNPIQAFSASFGKYKEFAFERAPKRGQTERDAALATMRAILFNIGMTKTLINESAKVGIVAPAEQ